MKQYLLKNSFMRGVLCLLLCVVGVGNVWGEDVTVTFDAKIDISSEASSINKDGITINATVLNGTNGYYQTFKNKTISISVVDGLIKQIVFTCTAMNANQYGPGCYSNPNSEGTYTYKNYIGTWSGSAETITLKASSNQVRMTKIEVTYEKATDVPNSLFFSGDPQKTTYYLGETPSAEGLLVNAVYLDEGTIDVTDDVEWAFNPETIIGGINEITATAKYRNVTKDYKFSVRVIDIYNLTPIDGGNQAYEETGKEILVNGVKWFVTGNSKMLPWRIGGKSLDKVDREIKCATPIKGIFGKVVVSVGETSKSITLNKIKLSVANNAEFENAQIYEHTNNLRANTEHTFDITPTTDGYYKITFNVTVSATSNNKYYEFLGATFYRTDNITIGSAGYATFSLPYNATVPDGLTAYAASQHGESIKLTKIESAKIAAGEGVVLKGEEGTYTFIATAEDVMPAENNLMVGVSKDTELVAADNVYLLTRKKDDGSIAFRLLNNNYTLGANKAYLKLKDNGASESRDFIPALWEEEATGIVDLNNVSGGLGKVYNLSGQRLLELQRGINIVNGKLVIK